MQEEHPVMLARLSSEDLGALLRALTDSPIWVAYQGWLREQVEMVRDNLETLPELTLVNLAELRGELHAYRAMQGFTGEARAMARQKEEELADGRRYSNTR